MKHASDPFGDPEMSEKTDRFSIARGHENVLFHDRWRKARSRSCGFGDPQHPFRHRGEGKAYTYKLFLEQAHSLCIDRGRLGFVVPSGLYSDHGTAALRRLFLDRCRWEWLFGIENRDNVFPIHRSFKFNPIIVERGGTTDAIRTAFMRRSLDDWERAEHFTILYRRSQVEQFSPRSRAILEIQSPRDLEVLQKIYANSVLLGDDGPDGWGIRYAQGDFNMTSDSRLFPPRPQWEAKGYRPDEYSRWLLGDWRPIQELWAEMGIDPSRPQPAEIEPEDWLFDTTAGPERRAAEARFVHGHLLKPGDVVRTDWRTRCAQPLYDRLPIPRADIPAGVILSRDAGAWIPEERIKDTALPVYQGIMVQPFVPSARGWISGTGLRAKWDYNSLGHLRWNPQYLMSQETVDQQQSVSSAAYAKVGYREVARSTDERSFMGAILPCFPCGHKVPILHLATTTIDILSSAIAFLNSFVFDWLVRRRLGAAALAWHVLAEGVLPRVSDVPNLVPIITKLNLLHNLFAPMRSSFLGGHIASHHALNPAERIRLRTVIDAVACILYGIDTSDLHHILSHADLPVAAVRRGSPHAKSLDARGFWRVDRGLPPELRHTVLSLVALRDLQRHRDTAGGDRVMGIESFLAQNKGEGWMLPETVRLADYGLGHDDRAKSPQPVASRLGPRFYDWQLAQSPEEARLECHIHARNLLGANRYTRLLAELIERRAIEGEDGPGLLTDVHTSRLLGDDGYVTTLVEVRARRLLDDDAYWTAADSLRDSDDPRGDRYVQLLDRLRLRGLLDDADYRCRSGRNPPAATDALQLRLTESGPAYGPVTSEDNRQGELFE